MYLLCSGIRQVNAGSCNACECTALTNPIYDVQRFGVDFVASPRHADVLLVTGPVSRQMELALKKTYLATPETKLVIILKPVWFLALKKTKLGCSYTRTILSRILSENHHEMSMPAEIARSMAAYTKEAMQPGPESAK